MSDQLKWIKFKKLQYKKKKECVDLLLFINETCTGPFGPPSVNFGWAAMVPLWHRASLQVESSKNISIFIDLIFAQCNSYECQLAADFPSSLCQTVPRPHDEQQGSTLMDAHNRRGVGDEWMTCVASPTEFSLQRLAGLLHWKPREMS